jgi:hypothetical protein
VYKKIPNLREMIPFYCPGVYHVTKEERKGRALEEKAQLCRMLGYDEDSKGFLVLNIEKRRTAVRSDVIFDSRIVEEYVDKNMLGSNHSTPEEDGEEEDVELEDEEDFQQLRGELGDSVPEAEGEDEDDDESTLEEDNDRSVENDYKCSFENQNDVNYSSTTQAANIIRTARIPQLTPAEVAELEILRRHEDPEPGYWEYAAAVSDCPYDYSAYDRFLVEEEEEEERDRVEKAREALGLYEFHLEVDVDLKNRIDGEYVAVLSDVIGQKIGQIALPKPPSDVSDALDPSNPDREKWREAIMKEMGVLDSYQVFKKAEDQAGHAMKTKLILTLTYNNDYTLKYKARLVVCGYSQIKGIDYKETFSPTTSTIIVMILLHVAASGNYPVANYDVTAAFLEGNNDCIQFCRLPKFLGGERVQIMKSLYGEKQAPKIWSDHLHKILTEMKFESCPVEPCLYKYTEQDANGGNFRFLYICLHVDDGLMVSSHHAMLGVFMKQFQTHIKKATLFDPLEKYIGIEIERERNRIALHQQTYIAGMEDLHKSESKKTFKIPMSNSVNLREQKSNPANPSLLPVTGKLRYVTDRTRPDLLVALGEISTGGADGPSDMHLKVSKQIVSYLLESKDRRLILGGDGGIKKFAFTDASYVTSGKCLSRLGGCIFLGEDSGAIYSYSKNDTTVSHSSTEAEIKALDEIIRVVTHVDNVLDFLFSVELNQSEPFIIYVDNQAAIELCKTLKTTHKTRHINMRINYIRQEINARRIVIQFVPTHLNVADVLTKPLADELYSQHTERLLTGFKGQVGIPRVNNITTIPQVYAHITATEPIFEYVRTLLVL